MPILADKSEGVLALNIEGDMTIYTAAALKQELMEHITQQCECEIDLSNVSKMDSAGMQLLIMAKREAARHNTALRLTGQSQAVQDVMDTYNMTAYFGDPISISRDSSA